MRVGLMLGILACGASPSVGTRQPATHRAQLHAPWAAFVVYSATETLLVPADGSDAVLAYGLWVLDEDAEGLELRHFYNLDHVEDATQCACDSQEGSCSREREFMREIDPTTFEISSAEPPCRCLIDGASMTMEEQLGIRQTIEWEATDLDGDRYENIVPNPECDQGETAVVSLYGGELYSLGWYWNGACTGASVYDSFAESRRLVSSRSNPIDFALSDVGCDPGIATAAVTPAVPVDPHDLPCGPDDAEPPRTEDDEPIDDGCSYCRDYHAEATVYVLGRGYLWAMSDNIFYAGGIRWYSRVPARPDNCPSSADPCGDPAAYPALVDSGEDFWVATDGSAALDTVLTVHLRDGTTHEVTESLYTDLIGVRYHTDATAIRQAIERSPVRLVTAPRPAAPTFSGPCDSGACPDGEVCIEDECTAACQSDDACHWQELCGGFCGTDGRCHTVGECDAVHPCNGDYVCDEGRCGPAARLAEEDADFEDGRGGRGWGERCVEHMRAGRLTHAMAACERGLEGATNDRTRGAILYNIGLVYARQGKIRLARQSYRDSLRARPNSAAVQRELDALEAR